MSFLLTIALIVLYVIAMYIWLTRTRHVYKKLGMSEDDFHHDFDVCVGKLTHEEYRELAVTKRTMISAMQIMYNVSILFFTLCVGLQWFIMLSVTGIWFFVALCVLLLSSWLMMGALKMSHDVSKALNYADDRNRRL